MYKMLNYRGDLTRTAEVGMILGEDEFGRPYEIIDADYDAESNMTQVHLQYATEDSLRRHFATD